MSKPILTERQIHEIWDKLTAGEPLDNEIAIALFKDNCYYSGELMQLQIETRRDRQDEQGIGMLLSDNYQKYSHGIPLGW